MNRGLERAKLLQLGGGFLFGALSYVGFNAIPYYFGPHIIGTIPSSLASILLFIVFASLAVVYIHLTRTGPGWFLLLAGAGGSLLFFIDAIRVGSSPALPFLYFSFLGTLVAGSLTYVVFTSVAESG